MIVIKMLKKASNMNTVELSNYLKKTRATIMSWEKDESTIPQTEKDKLCERFDFKKEYWEAGLDQDNSYYKDMFTEIKNGYINDRLKKDGVYMSREEEILIKCDYDDKYVRSNIDRTKELKNNMKAFREYRTLDFWRKRKAKEENVKEFQIISNKILFLISNNYVEGKGIDDIKGFPKDGYKYIKYSKEILEELKKGE